MSAGNASTSVSSDAEAGDTKGECLSSSFERYEASKRSVKTLERHFSGLTEAARFSSRGTPKSTSDDNQYQIF